MSDSLFWRVLRVIAPLINSARCPGVRTDLLAVRDCKDGDENPREAVIVWFPSRAPLDDFVGKLLLPTMARPMHGAELAWITTSSTRVDARDMYGVVFYHEQFYDERRSSPPMSAEALYDDRLAIARRFDLSVADIRKRWSASAPAAHRWLTGQRPHAALVPSVTAWLEDWVRGTAASPRLGYFPRDKDDADAGRALAVKVGRLLCATKGGKRLAQLVTDVAVERREVRLPGSRRVYEVVALVTVEGGDATPLLAWLASEEGRPHLRAQGLRWTAAVDAIAPHLTDGVVLYAAPVREKAPAPEVDDQTIEERDEAESLLDEFAELLGVESEHTNLRNPWHEAREQLVQVLDDDAERRRHLDALRLALQFALRLSDLVEEGRGNDDADAVRDDLAALWPSIPQGDEAVLRALVTRLGRAAAPLPAPAPDPVGVALAVDGELRGVYSFATPAERDAFASGAVAAQTAPGQDNLPVMAIALPEAFEPPLDTAWEGVTVDSGTGAEARAAVAADWREGRAVRVGEHGAPEARDPVWRTEVANVRAPHFQDLWEGAAQLVTLDDRWSAGDAVLLRERGQDGGRRWVLVEVTDVAPATDGSDPTPAVYQFRELARSGVGAVPHRVAIVLGARGVDA